MDLKELESGVNPATHWYYQSKKIPLCNYAASIATKKKLVVDVGAGSGFFSEALQKIMPDKIAQIIQVDTAYTPTQLAESNAVNCIKQHQLPDTMGNALVLLMDVLEHLEDDLGMLLAIKSKSVSEHENYFFITVPAFESIWSDHDVYLEHYRRYTKKSLTRLLNKAGFKITRTYYLYGSLFPWVFLKRKLARAFTSKNHTPQSDMKPLPAWLNSLLLKYSTLEMMITKYNRFFGLTCVAEGSF